MAKPYISALIDTYNQGHYIEEAIESVLAQDFPQQAIEIIVVDDGSTDDTPQRVKRFGDRISYICKPNGGQASALNAGFAASRGEIIALLDGDDTWRPRKIAVVAEALEKEPRVCMAYHAMSYRNEGTQTLTEDHAFVPIAGDVLESIEMTLRYGGVSTSCMALRRTALQRLFPIPEGMRIYADSYLAYLAIFLGPVVGLAYPLTQYRIHSENLASQAQRSKQHLEQRCRSFEQALGAIHGWLEKNGFDLRDKNTVAFLKRQELVSEMLRFTVSHPTRREYFQHLKNTNQLYGAIWRSNYRVFRAGIACAGFVLGYPAFERLRKSYAQSVAPQIREQLISTRAQSAPSGLSMSEAVGARK